MQEWQYYPTPESLARKAWGLFRNREFIRVLEPSAGDGALAKAAPGRSSWQGQRVTVDCVEIDISRHTELRNEGFNVVGIDFLQFGSGSMYSHIIMNPPFAQGAQHVLKAWDILWDGEIVALLNAETLRNPFSKERRLLVSRIEQHGSVEFIEGAFSIPAAERKTDVDVALVYLRKRADIERDILGSFVDDLKQDTMTGEGLASGYHDTNEIALPTSIIENSVQAFDAAVRAARESVFAEARAQRYTRLLGKTMAQYNGDADYDPHDSSVEWVTREMQKRYESLKDRAWASILRSTQLDDRLSSSARKQIESQFEQVKSLEYTVSNIYGFLLGLVQSQGQIQVDMACDVFDQIIRYHSDNTVFYLGWKSNDKHRTAGMRIKTTRFVLPHHGTDSWQRGLSWDSMQLLADFDKVFAMLDSKIAPETALTDVFRHRFEELRRGGRVSSSYFDVRYYPGVGTIHFFPRDKSLVDRLNRLVGRQRRWLPPEDMRVSEAFWLQYDRAEKYDKEVRAEIMKRHAGGRYWDNPLHRLGTRDTAEGESAMAAIDEAVASVLSRHGIDVDKLLEPLTPRLTAA